LSLDPDQKSSLILRASSIKRKSGKDASFINNVRLMRKVTIKDDLAALAV